LRERFARFVQYHSWVVLPTHEDFGSLPTVGRLVMRGGSIAPAPAAAEKPIARVLMVLPQHGRSWLLRGP
jgi:hypothetical protein